MGDFDGLVVVQRDFTAAAGQTQPVPSPTMSAGDVRWVTRTSLGVYRSATTHTDHLNATISRICLITALSSHPTAQKVRATA